MWLLFMLLAIIGVAVLVGAAPISGASLLAGVLLAVLLDGQRT